MWPRHSLMLYTDVMKCENLWVVSDSVTPKDYSPWDPLGQNTGVGSLSLLQGSSQPRIQTGVPCIVGGFFINWAIKLKVKVAQSCPTLCDPMDHTVNEILQARILEWIAFPFSRGSSQPRDRTQVSHIAGRFFTSWATREALTTSPS